MLFACTDSRKLSSCGCQDVFSTQLDCFWLFDRVLQESNQHRVPKEIVKLANDPGIGLRIVRSRSNRGAGRFTRVFGREEGHQASGGEGAREVWTGFGGAPWTRRPISATFKIRESRE